MGKKRVVKPSKESLLAERELVEERAIREAAKIKKKLDKARLYINSSYNNTMFTLTDEKGNVVFWTSAGKLGFKGTKKGTPFAATKAAEVTAAAINKAKIKEVEVYVKGVGQGREAGLRALANRGVNIVLIKDVTPIPHNGCRPKKPRRV